MKKKRLALLVIVLFVTIRLFSLPEITKTLESYSNGAPKKVAFSHGDLKINEKIYSKKGILKYIKNYFDDQNFGYWFKLNKNEEVIERGNFIVGEFEDDFFKGIDDGYYIVNYPNKSIKIKAFFFNNMLNGNYVEYYENGNIKTLGAFEDGSLFGDLQHFNENNVLNRTSMSNGEYSYYYHYSEKGLIRSIDINSNGKKVSSLNFNDFGTIEEQRIFCDDYKDQSVSVYYDNGQIKFKHNLLNLNYHGLSISYYRNGFTKIIGNKDNGIRIGEWKMFYESGILKQKVIYSENVPPDTYIDTRESVFEYYSNGKLKIKVFYDNNKMSRFMLYDKFGDITIDIEGNENIVKNEISNWYGNRDFIIEFRGYE